MGSLPRRARVGHGARGLQPEGGTAWEYFDHDQARSRAYRWNEDGMGGICDEHQRLCFALSLWNGRDPILKERAFGLTGNQGNHGEDVKEYYFYLDATPSHSWMRYLYKYPQAEYPYGWLVEENRRRSRHDPAFTLLDTGVFNDGRYFDVEVRYAKASPEEMHIRVIATNHGPEAAPLHLIPNAVVPQHVVLGRSGRQAGAPGDPRAQGRQLGGAGRPSDARHLLSLRSPRRQGAVHREREQRASACGTCPALRPT